MNTLADIPKVLPDTAPVFKSSGIIIRGSGRTQSPFKVLNRFLSKPLSSFKTKSEVYQEFIEGSSKHLVFYDPGTRLFFKIPVKGRYKKPMFILSEVPKVISDGYLVVGCTDSSKSVFRVTRKDLVRKRVGSARRVPRDALLHDDFLTRRFGDRPHDNLGTTTDPGADHGENPCQDLRAVEGAPAVGEAYADLGVEEQIFALSRI